MSEEIVFESIGPECAEMRRRASARLDGECAHLRGLDAHLARCSACRAYAEELAATSMRLAVLRGGEPARDLWPAIEARVRAARARPAPSRSHATGLRLAAACAGFVATAGALHEALGAAAAPAVPTESALSQESTAWTHALGVELPEQRSLVGAPETRLLAAFAHLEESR